MEKQFSPSTSHQSHNKREKPPQTYGQQLLNRRLQKENKFSLAREEKSLRARDGNIEKHPRRSLLCCHSRGNFPDVTAIT